MRAFIVFALVALIFLGAESRLGGRPYPSRPSRNREPSPPPSNFDETCPDFDTWKARYGKSYRSPREEYLRERIYGINKMKVESDGYEWQGCNQFADMTSAEFMKTYSDTNLPSDTNTRELGFFFSRGGEDDVPPKTDWSDKLSPAKEQGSCGSSWAHAAVDLAEAANNRKGYSPQPIIDCSWKSTCGSGTIEDSVDFLLKNGASTLSDYPMTGQAGTCRNTPKDSL